MMSEECEWCEWFVWGGVDIHSISEHDKEFEAIVNVEVKCSNCGRIERLVMDAHDEVSP